MKIFNSCLTRLLCLTILMTMLLSVTGCGLRNWAKREFGGLSESDILSIEPRSEESVKADADRVYELSIPIVDEMSATIIKNDPKKRMIVALGFDKHFPSCLNTTEVGIIIKEKAPGRSRVIVTSESSELAILVASELSVKLEERLNK